GDWSRSYLGLERAGRTELRGQGAVEREDVACGVLGQRGDPADRGDRHHAAAAEGGIQASVGVVAGQRTLSRAPPGALAGQPAYEDLPVRLDERRASRVRDDAAHDPDDVRGHLAAG